ncbi:MAG: acetyltransferase domain protein [Gemmatimonadetes bacterium]|nr:acetyltransferase domain protein [Gemmatimonadota bacterium]
MDTGPGGEQMEVRRAEQDEVDRLATIWYDGWQDAHAELLPAELARERTRVSMHARLTAALPSVRVVGPSGAPVGFSMTRDDQLYQLYVSAEARGSGAAAALVAEVETRMLEAGVRVAWLACAIGNVRAARFYEKCGWRLRGTVIERLTLSNGELDLEVWRYEKALTPTSRA